MIFTWPRCVLPAGPFFDRESRRVRDRPTAPVRWAQPVKPCDSNAHLGIQPLNCRGVPHEPGAAFSFAFVACAPQPRNLQIVARNVAKSDFAMFAVSPDTT